jgi:predicted nuclease of predicted toxin-antitoxin system
VWLRTGNCTTSNLNPLLAAHAGQIEVFAGDEKEAVLVIA